MAINISDNIKVQAGKPVDAKYLSSTNAPYASVAAVNTAIAISDRHVGLTVNIMGVEYWYNGGVADGNLVIKTAGSGTPIDAITGASNIGFYQGLSGVQVLPMNHQTDNTYDGDYYSLYNNYYRGTDGKVHIGTPADGIPKRGYVKTASPVKSWIWNEYTGDGLLGWILMDGNISQKIGQFDNGYTYYNGSTTFPYVQTSWSGTPPPNGSNVVIDAIRGSLATGTTITIGGGVFAQEVDNVLEFRTIETKTPNTISISSDEAFIYISGKTQVTQGANVGTGTPVFKQLTGNTLQFRSILGSGDTIVTQSGDNVVIYSSGSTGGGVYNLSSPAAITVGGITAGTPLTGKTSFQLFEELLVPALPPAVSAPSNTFAKTSPSGSQFEVGQTIGLTFGATFSRGLINPLYFGTPPYVSVPRSGLPTFYNYTGTGLPASPVSSGGLLTNTQTVPSYGVLAGSQSWSGTVTYASGATAVYDSKGTILQPALPSGTTSAQSVSVTGIYPYFWGISDTAPVAGQLLINSGTKVVATSSGPVTVTYNASDKYLWLAIPTGANKIRWTGSNSPTNTEVIPGGLFPAKITQTGINSPTSLWSGQSYDFYISNYKTSTYESGSPFNITFS
jgi:hypothetical protein